MTLDDPTVVVVEDDQELADTYANWLADEYRVQVAYDAESALDCIDETTDAVLLDRRLPDRPGSTVVEALRERGLTCSVAIITAVDPDFDILEMGFDDYVVKPVLRDDLLDLVHRMLRVSRYDGQFRESFGLVSKLAVLEEEKSRAELEGSEEYAETKDRFESVQHEIEATLADFEDQDFMAAYRSLTREPDGSEP